MPRGADIVSALRPRQWAKNLLVAAAPAAAAALGEPDVSARTAAAVAVFTCASAATYLGNDAADVEVDRRHPTRRNRPIAAGRIEVRFALALAAMLAVVATVAGAFVAPGLGAVIGLYLAVNLGYSLGLKRVPWLELAIVASGFVLRAIAGGSATGIPLSGAFIAVVSAASTFVVAGKRSAELVRTGGVDGRAVLSRYRLRTLRGLRAVSAAAAVIAYTMWLLGQPDARAGFAAGSLVAFTAALGAYERALGAGRGEDPEDIFLGDRAVQAVAACWCLCYGAAVYG